MRKKNLYKLYAIILLLASCFLYYRTHLNKIISPDDYFLSCTDFGQYLLEVQDYSREYSYFRGLLKVGEDPGFFVVTSNLLRISGISAQSLLPFLSMFMYCLVGMTLFLIGTKITTKNRFLTGLICVLLYISLYGNINANFSGIWRQVMGHLFFLLFLFSFLQTKNNYKIIGIIFFAMSVLTHRIFFIFGPPSFFFVIISSFFYDKKNFKTNIYLFVVILFLCAPYFLYFRGYVYHYIEYLISLGKDTKELGGYLEYKNPKYLGFSFYGKQSGEIAISHYFDYQGYIFIFFIAYLIKLFGKIGGLYIFVSLFVLAYVSGRLDFSIRVLLFFELIIIPFLALNRFNYGRHQRLCILLSIFFIGLTSISEVRLKREASQKIDINEGINFLINNIDKKEPHFIMGTVCTSDLMSQLGYTNHFNTHMLLYRVREAKKNQELDFGDLEKLVLNNIFYLKRDGILLDIFKDKSIYIVFIDSDRTEVNLIQKGKSGLLGKKYLTLIYPQDPNVPGEGKIKYIFKIEIDNITYADSKSYINQNVENFNLKIDN